MNIRGLFRKSIQLRFFATAVIPLFLVTSLLTYYNIQSRGADAERTLYEDGELGVAYLADISEFDFYSGNYSQLLSKANSVLSIPKYTGVMYLDRKRRILVNTARFPQFSKFPIRPITTPVIEKSNMYFERPIFLEPVNIDDYAPSGNFQQQPAVAGYVIFAVDRGELVAQQHHILITSLLLAVAAFLVAISLAMLLSRTITTPLKRLTAGVSALQKGHLKTRVDIGSDDELAILAEGVNQLASLVERGQKHLLSQVQIATTQLQEALKDLQLRNRELEKARQLAEEAGAAKGEFLARMSHELRTPLTAIQGFIRLLEQGNLGQEDRNYCHIINQASDQLLNLIDDTLVFSRLNAGVVGLEIEPFDLGQCLGQILHQMAPVASKKKIELVVDIAPEVPLQRMGDSFRLQQIISNLLSNAIKFTPAGGVYVQVTGDAPLSVEIRDTGIGIPKKNQEQIFNAFAQADTSTTRRFGGTGLGLAIVKQLVDLIGGRINLSSEEGIGTQVRLELPLPLDVGAGSQPSYYQKRDLKLLLCDTTPRSAKAMIHALARFTTRAISVCYGTDIIRYPGLTAGTDIIVANFEDGHADQPQQIDAVIAACRRLETPLIGLIDIDSLQKIPASAARGIPGSHLLLPKPASIPELGQALDRVLHSVWIDERSVEQKDNQPLSGLNIMVAEDNQLTQTLLQTIIIRHGGHVTTAANGQEAIDACHREVFDLLLIDVHMPKIGGIEAIRTIRRDCPNNAGAAIIALTADILHIEQDDLYRAGADRVELKPINHNDLIRMIAELCRRSVPVEEQTAPTEEIPASVYWGEIKKLLAGCRKAIGENNEELLRDQLHQLIGVAGLFRLSDIEVKARSMHRTIKEGGLEKASPLLSSLEQCLPSPMTRG